MKVLDVDLFQDGLKRNITMLDRLENEVEAIHHAVEGLVAMDEELKGVGGDAIRAFYAECHLPVLQHLVVSNNTFNVDELFEIRKEMADLGIAKVYDEALIKIDFGKYLRGLIGDPPSAMINPHAHHILFKKGLGQKQQELVREGQEILRKYGVDPIIGEENLVWAPNAVTGQHSLDALKNVVNQLKSVEIEGGDFDDIVEVLEELGNLASRR